MSNTKILRLVLTEKLPFCQASWRVGRLRNGSLPLGRGHATSLWIAKGRQITEETFGVCQPRVPIRFLDAEKEENPSMVGRDYCFGMVWGRIH